MKGINSSRKIIKSNKILIVGLCCIDEINFVDKFPSEDSDTRIFEQSTSLGGNAANCVTVLSQLNTNCELFAAIPTNNFTLEGLIQRTKICVDNCIYRPSVNIPKSTVILNRTNGSRTIFHYRGLLPELKAREFISTFGNRLCDYSWIHFEGRNFDEIKQMMEHIKSQKDKCNKLTISVELEKLRPYPFLEQLIPLADLLFVSKDFAQAKGWNLMIEAVEGVQSELGASASTVICAWGEKGAAGRVGLNGEMLVQEATKPKQVIDTLGAGDCFIGACLHFLNQGCSFKEVLENGCKIAGNKCGQRGLLNLCL